MWKLTFEAPLGLRSMKGFDSITTCGMWLNGDTGLWSNEISKSGWSSSHDVGVKSVKAFIRYLGRHKELKGVEVTLVSRGYLKFDDDEVVSLDVRANWVDTKSIEGDL